MTTKPKEIKQYSAQIVKNGHSYQIVIPAHIRKYINLNVGDLLEVRLKLIKKAQRHDDNDTTRRTHNLEGGMENDTRENNGSGGKI
ncbi:MAG: AbrB/MazE/SpoVT family DNA-binding domain-containing protein [Candidatus Woesearchaeota archaeon]